MFSSWGAEELEEQWTTDVKVTTDCRFPVVNSRPRVLVSRHRDFEIMGEEYDEEIVASDELVHIALELDMVSSIRLV